MGGYGSTRWGTHRKKTTVEECKILTISLLIDGINYVIENDYEWRGNVSWSCEGEPRGKISCLVYLENETPKLKLQYTFTKSGKEMDYTVQLTYSTLHWGTKRWWFICPLIKGGRICNRRVGKLYLSPGYDYFGCRHCYELTYTSCQESHRFDSLYASMAGMMNITHPEFSFGDAKRAIKNLDNRWGGDEKINELYYRSLARIEEQEERKRERLSRYLTANELCRQSGLTKEELEKLKEFRLLLPDTKEGKYRPKLVGWGKKIKEKLSNEMTYEEIKKWTKERWK